MIKNHKINLVVSVAMILAVIFACRAPAIFFGMIIVAYSEKFYAIFPLLVCLAYAAVAFTAIKNKKQSLLVTSLLGAALLLLAIVGKMQDFTAYGSSGPGPWEWLNSLSPAATVLIIVLALTKYFVYKRHITT